MCNILIVRMIVVNLGMEFSKYKIYNLYASSE